MSVEFSRDSLLKAFDEIGHAAIAAGTRLEICVYGGSALMIAGNFRWATEDVDIAPIGDEWPEWLQTATKQIASRYGWDEHWLNEGVKIFLSRTASREADHVLAGTFPRRHQEVGLSVYVPTARYLLALKLRAARVANPIKGKKDMGDMKALLKTLGITSVEEGLEIVASYFPVSISDMDRERFVLNFLLKQETPANAPSYPGRSVSED